MRHDLKVWLEKYRLGELWTRGHLGGKSLVSVKVYSWKVGALARPHAEDGRSERQKLSSKFIKFFKKAGFKRENASQSSLR